MNRLQSKLSISWYFNADLKYQNISLIKTTFIFQSKDACREKEEMACRYEKWRWKKIKSYFLDRVSRRNGNEENKYPYLDQKASSISNCC